jgi:hypothetical protein
LFALFLEKRIEVHIITCTLVKNWGKLALLYQKVGELELWLVIAGLNGIFGGALDSVDTNLSCMLVEGDLEYS